MPDESSTENEDLSTRASPKKSEGVHQRSVHEEEAEGLRKSCKSMPRRVQEAVLEAAGAAYEQVSYRSGEASRVPAAAAVGAGSELEQGPGGVRRVRRRRLLGFGGLGWLDAHDRRSVAQDHTRREGGVRSHV